MIDRMTRLIGTPSFPMSLTEAAEGMSLDLKKDLSLKVALPV